MPGPEITKNGCLVSIVYENLWKGDLEKSMKNLIYPTHFLPQPKVGRRGPKNGYFLSTIASYAHRKEILKRPNKMICPT